jgi:hypothetical protein
MNRKLCLGTLLLAGLAWFSSCEKADSTDVKLDGSTLEGVWNMRLLIGGNVANDPINLIRVRQNLWVFRGTSFQRIYGDSVWHEGTFSVSRGTGINNNTGGVVDQFILNNQPAQSFELRADTLRVYYGIIAADGAAELYVKVDD